MQLAETTGNPQETWTDWLDSFRTVHLRRGDWAVGAKLLEGSSDDSAHELESEWCAVAYRVSDGVDRAIWHSSAPELGTALRLLHDKMQLADGTDKALLVIQEVIRRIDPHDSNYQVWREFLAEQV